LPSRSFLFDALFSPTILFFGIFDPGATVRLLIFETRRRPQQRGQNSWRSGAAFLRLLLSGASLLFPRPILSLVFFPPRASGLVPRVPDDPSSQVLFL